MVGVGGTDSDQFAPWPRIAEGGRDTGLTHTPRRDDPIVLLYTSGTTGLPKGAVHTHRFLASLVTAADRMALTPDDCVVLYLPLFHVYALMAGLVLMSSVGAKIVLMRRFDSAQSLALIEAEHATIVYGVPTTYLDQLNDPTIDGRDLSGVRLSITPFARDLCERVSARFGFCANCFGMTETASMAFLPQLTDPPDVAIGTAGRPLQGLEVKIIDEVSGKQAGPYQPGSLLLRGPLIMAEYHDQPHETAEAFDEDGWFRTGDIASLDEGGNLMFGRPAKRPLQGQRRVRRPSRGRSRAADTPDGRPGGRGRRAPRAAGLRPLRLGSAPSRGGRSVGARADRARCQSTLAFQSATRGVRS